MKWETMFLAAFIVVVVTFIVGIGAAVYSDSRNRQEFKLACINSGKSLIENSCVRTAP